MNSLRGRIFAKLLKIVIALKIVGLKLTKCSEISKTFTNTTEI